MFTKSDHRTVAVFSSPYAKKGHNGEINRAIEERKSQTLLHFLTETEDEFLAAIQECNRLRIYKRVVNGGDGSLSKLVNLELELIARGEMESFDFKRVLHGSLDTGSVNLAAEYLGTTGDPFGLLDHWEQTDTFSLPKETINVLCVNDGTTQRYGLMYAAGALIDGLDIYYEHLEKYPITAFLKVLWELRKKEVRNTYRPLKYDLSFTDDQGDSQSLEDATYTALTASTIPAVLRMWPVSFKPFKEKNKEELIW